MDNRPKLAIKLEINAIIVERHTDNVYYLLDMSDWAAQHPRVDRCIIDDRHVRACNSVVCVCRTVTWCSVLSFTLGLTRITYMDPRKCTPFS